MGPGGAARAGARVPVHGGAGGEEAALRGGRGRAAALRGRPAAAPAVAAAAARPDAARGVGRRAARGGAGRAGEGAALQPRAAAELAGAEGLRLRVRALLRAAGAPVRRAERVPQHRPDVRAELQPAPHRAGLDAAPRRAPRGRAGHGQLHRAALDAQLRPGGRRGLHRARVPAALGAREGDHQRERP